MQANTFCACVNTVIQLLCIKYKGSLPWNVKWGCGYEDIRMLRGLPVFCLCDWIQGEKGTSFHYWHEHFFYVSSYFLLLLLNPFPVAFGWCNAVDFWHICQSFQAKGPRTKNTEHCWKYFMFLKYFRFGTLKKVKELKDWVHKAAEKQCELAFF